jgi:hypothetical protein
VAVRAEANPAGAEAPPVLGDLEDDPLALTEVTEDASLEGSRNEIDGDAVGVCHDSPATGGGVVDLHHPLHSATPFRPCRP